MNIAFKSQKTDTLREKILLARSSLVTRQSRKAFAMPYLPISLNSGEGNSISTLNSLPFD
jgi:hypothetical protein